MDDLRFSLLGAVWGFRSSTELALGSPQQQAVLVRLLLGHDGAATAAELVDGLWGGDPPATAKKALRTYAWRLRGLLETTTGTQPLSSLGDGYRLAVRREAVDVFLAEDLIGQARDAEDLTVRLRHLDEALQLWRGEPLAGIPGPFAAAQRRRLHELRLTVLERRFDLEIMLGNAQWCVPRLRSLSDEHPLRESLYVLLMRSLHESDRRPEALEVFRTARLRLVDEIGMEPGAELERLHQEVLGGLALTRPDPQQAALRPAQLPGTIADFVGRAGQVDLLSDALLGSGNGSPPLAAISGMGGLGKTTLVRHVAHHIKDRFPDGQLYADLRGGDALPLPPDVVIASFLAALGAPSQSVPENLADRSAYLRSMLDGRRLLIVLDDARDVAQVAPLLPGSAGCAVLVTSRSRLLDLAGAIHIGLEAFDVAEAMDLLRRTVGDARVAADPDGARELVRACEGLPLAVRIVAARLAARPSWGFSEMSARLADARHRRVDALQAGDLSLAATFEAGLRHLETGQRQAFTLLSLTDIPELSPASAAALLSAERPVDELAAEDLLESLVDLALLESVTAGRFRFHPLLRSFARSRHETGPGRDQEAAGLRLSGYFRAAAVSAFQQAVPGDPVAQVLGLVDAGLFDTPAAARAWAGLEMNNIVALVHQICRDPGSGSTLIGQASDLMIALSPYGPDPHLPSTTEMFRTLLAAARRTGSAQAQGRAHFLLGTAALDGGRLAEAIADAGEAVRLCRAAGDDVILRQALNDLGLAVQKSGDHDRCAELYGEAIRLARRIGHRSGELMTTVNLALNEVYRKRPAVAARLCRDVLAATERVPGDTTTEAYAEYVLALALSELGEHEDAARRLVRCVELSERSGLRLRAAQARYRLADALRSQGLPRSALEQAVAAVRECERIADERDHAKALTALARVHDVLGDRESARTCLTRAHEIFTRLRLPEATETQELLTGVV